MISSGRMVFVARYFPLYLNVTFVRGLDDVPLRSRAGRTYEILCASTLPA
jgi:hypothetical protein